MNIQLFKPHSTLLQNYIEFYYFLNRSRDEEPITYLVFPNYYTMVSVSSFEKVIVNQNKVSVVADKRTKLYSVITTRFTKPILFEYLDEVNEITIAFKPLGINAFLPHELNFYAKDTVYGDSFNPYEDYNEKMFEILSITKEKEKRNALESYWLSKFIGFNHPFLFQVVNSIMNMSENESSIIEIAAKNNTTPKTLIQHFEKHICKTPSDFRKVVRFRNALKQKTLGKTAETLTGIGYISNYFDQSHMIKDFKALTGFTPKQFFKKLTTQFEGNFNLVYNVPG